MKEEILQAYQILKNMDHDCMVKLAVLIPNEIIGTTDSLNDEIRSLYAKGKRIDAIKLCRGKKSFDLKEAKNYCDRLVHLIKG
jgi:ribosomal protein L7/L12